jgi:membrane-associated phospholipid phosphatase
MAGYSYKAGDATGQDVAGFSLMFAQALALQSGINLMVRSLEFWPRPYIYAEDGAGARKAKKAEAEAYGSFFSGHTSAAFTVAVFTGEWFSEFYPESSYRGVVWVLALSAAGLEGVLRVAAGKHFWSDVAVGALLGTGGSLAVIQVHKKRSDRVSLWAGPGSVGLTVRM